MLHVHASAYLTPMFTASDRPRLLFIYLKRTTFVEEDLRLLRENFDVRPFAFEAEGGTPFERGFELGRQLARQLRWLRRELPHADVIFGWFADYHLILPALLGRWTGTPLTVVNAGFDCNHLPELGYGVYDSTWRGPLARFVCRRADRLLPVAEALIHSENAYATWPAPRANGLKANVPGLETPCHVVPFGYDAGTWPMGPPDRERVVTTVALVSDERTLRVKGIDLLIEAARELPDAEFRIVGVDEAFAASLQAAWNLPANVHLLPPRPREALPEVYAEASVYAQVSRTEGMPNVLCEAMLSGCIPVGSPVAGIPEVIGEAGYLVERPEPAHLATVLQRALDEATPKQREAARARIANRFTLEKRREALYQELSDFIRHGTRS